MGTKNPICSAFSIASVTGALLLGMSDMPLRADEGNAGIIPAAQYANLPADGNVPDPGSTGSLPKEIPLPAFSALVSRGAIIVREDAPTDCIPDELREVVASIADKFGPLSVESTHRSRSHNWRAGGARHSLHLACRAVDFRVHARTHGVMAYLRALPEVGGLKIYRNGIIHIDNGSRRSW